MPTPQIPALISDEQAADIFAETLSPPQQPGPKPGEVIGAYTLVEELGDGGFATVWLATQQQPVKREVALKILKLGMDTLEVLGRFEQERQILALMEHPNIAKVLDAGTTPEGRPYFVMELVRGMPITMYCVAKRLSMDQRLSLFSDVCAGMNHAHQRGIIHRDLKPNNILVTEIDGQAVPKIIDFGIAKATTPGSLTEFTLATQQNQLIGTPLYMSPEQADAQPDLDTRTDVYALGAVLYELLTCRPPFDRKTLHTSGRQAMMQIIREVVPKRPSEWKTDEKKAGSPGDPSVAEQPMSPIARDLDLITLKALEKDRERRYDSVTALAQDLQRFLNHEPVSARPPSVFYYIRRGLRRHWVVAVSSAALLTGLALVSALLVRQKWQADVEARSADGAITVIQDIVATTAKGQMDKGVTRADILEAASESASHLKLSPEREMMLQWTLGNAWARLTPQCFQHFKLAEQAALKMSPVPAEKLLRLRLNLAFAYYKFQRKDEGLSLIEAILPECERTLDRKGRGFRLVLRTYALLLTANDRGQEAVETFDKLFALLTETYGDAVPDSTYFLYRSSYGRALLVAGRTEEGLKEGKDLIAKAKATRSSFLLEVISSHARNCIDAGRLDEALAHYREVLELQIAGNGVGDPVTLTTKENLLKVLAKMHNSAEALRVQKDYVERLNRSVGRNHEITKQEQKKLTTMEKPEPSAKAASD